MADILGYTKGDRDWHKVTAQGQVHQFIKEPGEALGPPHRKVSLTVCKLRLANTQLSASPDDDYPVCPACAAT